MQALRRAYVGQARSRSFGKHWSGPPELVERIVAILGTTSQDAVLDVGCGIGGPARRLAARVGCRVVAVDVLPELLEVGRKEGGERVAYGAASANRLPFRAAAFDQVWCLGALSHFSDPAEFAREAARVLAAGGALAVTEAFRGGPRTPRFRGTAPAPWYPVRVEAFAKTLRDAGFHKVEIRPWPAVDLAPPPLVRNSALRADLLDGRLRSELVVARS